MLENSNSWLLGVVVVGIPDRERVRLWLFEIVSNLETCVFICIHIYNAHQHHQKARKKTPRKNRK